MLQAENMRLRARVDALCVQLEKEKAKVRNYCLLFLGLLGIFCVMRLTLLFSKCSTTN